MSYSSLPFASHLFKLTSLTCALALAGCGGGDGTDTIAPKPDTGVQQPGTGTGGNNGNNGGGEQIPDVEPEFFLQRLSTTPTIVELSNAPTTFSVTVKAAEVASGGALSGKAVTLRVVNSETNGITIEGQSTQTTDTDGNAVYTLKLNPQAVSDTNALIAQGFTLIATANRADGTAIAPQELKVSVSRQGSGDGTPVTESTLDITSSISTNSVSNNALNPYGDNAQLTVIAKDSKGARVQDVKVGLGIANIKGISIVGGNSKVTNTDGIATFNIKIDENLSNAERDKLLQGQGIVYAINIQEQNGATKQTTGNLSIALPVSDYELTIANSSKPLSAYGDTQQLTLTAKPKNNSVPTNIEGAKVAVKLNNAPAGVSLANSQLTLDSKGQATIALTVAPALNDSMRKALAKDGISYTVTLSEPNRSITPKTFKSAVEIPVAQNVVSFEGSDKKQISSSGGSAVISFRVNDKNGGAVAEQSVSATLPTSLTNSGLLTIDSSSKQVTNARGIVSYTVRVPAGLTEAQKVSLEKIGNFILSVNAIEASGASSVASSERITIGSDIGRSDIALTAKSIPTIVNVLEDQFNLQIAAKRKNGSAAASRTVKLVLNEGSSAGVTIRGNQQTTNTNGIAEFNIGISQSLTQDQRDQLIKSGIGYTAILTDEDGTQSKITQTIKVQQPSTSIQFASIATPTISELGGSGNIDVKLTTKGSNAKPVESRAIAIQLGAKAKEYGITMAESNATTDFSGEATFVVTIPSGLTAQQRADLKNTGINYQLSYVENNVTYKSETQKVKIVTPTVDLRVLNATNNIENQAGYILNNVGSNATIQAQLNNQSSGEQVADQPIKLAFANKTLASLLTVNGQIGSANIVANTDANGSVSFNVVVPNNLTDEQKEALSKQVLTATLTETLTGKQQQIKIKVQSMTATISLLASPAKALNLNGGETQIEVVAKDKKGNIVAGQRVFLALPANIASKGVTLVSGGSQTTDDSGKAVFTIAVPSSLTDEQKTSIGRSINVVLSAADTSGNIVTQRTSVSTVAPTGTSEALTMGANKVVNTKGDTFKVFVRLENKNGGIANRSVRLNVDNPLQTGVKVTNGTATTNSDGVATFDLSLEAGANVNQAILAAGIKLTATTTTAENVKLTQNYIVAVDTATIDSYQLIASSDKSTLNTGGDQTNAIFRVTDSKGGILTGVPVQLNIENLEASGAALTTPSTVTTDASGQIDVGIILAANTVNARLNHSVVINAKIVTPQYDADGNVSMQVREEKSLSLSAVGTVITLAASATQLKDGENTTITTTLTDGSGRAIANSGMELVDANGSLITARSLTNAEGKVSFNIKESDLTFDSNGNLRIFARALGEETLVAQRSTSSIALVKVSRAGISFSNILGLYDVNVSNSINVQIRTDTAAQANALIGKRVEVQTTLGSFVNGQVITTKVITANDIDNSDNRLINIPVQLTSELAGTTVLQATVLGEMSNGVLKYQTTVDTRFRATTPAKMLFQAVKSVITPGGSTEVIATVKDKNDVPVEGQVVVFSRVSDSSAGRLSAATAVTDSKGEARVVYLANASSPIGGVVINARLLTDNANIGTKTTDITVSEEAVYTTLAFSNKLSSDDIYYTAKASISVMDGSGRAVPNKEVSIKSYAIEYAQGRVCLLDSSYSYLGSFIIDFSELTPILLRSNWLPTEDPEYNYTLDKDADININDDNSIGNGRLDPINPVAIIDGTLSGDEYTFVTNEEGRADFNIRYPLRYSNWTKVRFDASTFVNGSENTQSINYVLPSIAEDVNVVNSTLVTPWIGDASPFGTGGARCTTNMSVTLDPANQGSTTVRLSPYNPDYKVWIDSEQGIDTSDTNSGIFKASFNEVYSKGSIVNVSNNGFSFSKIIKIDNN